MHIIDLKIENLKNLKQCISLAQNKEDVKACRAISLKINKEINHKAQNVNKKVGNQQGKLKRVRKNRSQQ